MSIEKDSLEKADLELLLSSIRILEAQISQGIDLDPNEILSAFCAIYSLLNRQIIKCQLGN